MNILDILEDYCREEDIDLDLLLRDIQRMSFYETRIEIKNALKSAEKPTEITWSGESDQRLRRYCIWARQIHFVYGIPADLFGLPNDWVYSGINANAVRESTVLNLKTTKYDESLNAAFVKDYYEALSPPIRNLRSSLIVYDYLEKFRYDGQKYLIPYFDVHRDLYSAIEDKIKTSLARQEQGRGFQYVRYLALPLNDPMDERENRHELVKEALKLCSEPLFEHIFRCLARFHDLCDARPPGSGFYVLSKAPRNYHYGIFDRGKFLFTEYYRYSRKGFFKPDIMFLQKGDATFEKLTRHYQAEHESLLDLANFDDPPKAKIRLSEINDALIEAKLEVIAERVNVQNVLKQNDDDALGVKLDQQLEAVLTLERSIMSKLQFIESYNSK